MDSTRQKTQTQHQLLLAFTLDGEGESQTPGAEGT
jgi:hypothetical protein